MSYNRPRDYFHYKGKCYGIGTVVKIKPEPYGSRREIERCDGVAKFVGGLDNGYLKFSGVVPRGERYCGIAITTTPEERIEEIIEPVYYEYKSPIKIARENYKKAPDIRKEPAILATIAYIVVFIAGAIFKARIIIWIIATIIYVKHLIDLYR